MFSCMQECYWNKKGEIYVERGSDADFASVYSKEQHNRWARIEDTSWWYRYRGEVVRSLLDLFFDKNCELLDVGGGNGYATRIAQSEGYNVAILEPSEEGCINAKRRGIKNIYCGFLDDNSVLNEMTDQVMILDVLEHIEDDRDFLKQIHAKLKHHGRCLITVPAFQCLWSSEDVKARHFRRYSIEQLEELAYSVGFRTVYKNYFMWFLFIPIMLIRVFMEQIGLLPKATNRTIEQERKIEEKQFKERKGILGNIISVCQRRELNRIKKKKRILFGSSIVMVIEKV